MLERYQQPTTPSIQKINIRCQQLNFIGYAFTLSSIQIYSFYLVCGIGIPLLISFSFAWFDH